MNYGLPFEGVHANTCCYGRRYIPKVYTSLKGFLNGPGVSRGAPYITRTGVHPSGCRYKRIRVQLLWAHLLGNGPTRRQLQCHQPSTSSATAQHNKWTIIYHPCHTSPCIVPRTSIWSVPPPRRGYRYSRPIYRQVRFPRGFKQVPER